jgi:hypothetical protein
MCLVVPSSAIINSDCRLPVTEGHPIQEWSFFFFADSRMQIGSFHVQCSTGAHDSAAISSNAMGAGSCAGRLSWNF